MKSIPRPLFKRLVLIPMIGTGCFFIGLAFYYYQADRTFFLLSALLLFLSVCKSLLLLRIIKKEAFEVLEGTCTAVYPSLFKRSYRITLVGCEGEEYNLQLNKDCKVHTGFCYRFYFITQAPLKPVSSPLLEKAFLTDNLLGVEIIQNNNI